MSYYAVSRNASSERLRTRTTICQLRQLLNQTFAPTAPNQVWYDHVCCHTGGMVVPLASKMFIREIVGYAMGERMTKELTGKVFLFMALRSQRPPAGPIHHSDRGSQYCAYDYRVIQEQFGLKHQCRVKVTVTTTLRWKASGER